MLKSLLVLFVGLSLAVPTFGVIAKPNDQKDDWLYLDTDLNNTYLYIDKTASRYGAQKTSVSYKVLLISSDTPADKVASVIFSATGSCVSPYKIQLLEIFYFDKDSKFLGKLKPEYISEARKRSFEDVKPTSFGYKLLQKACQISQ